MAGPPGPVARGFAIDRVGPVLGRRLPDLPSVADVDAPARPGITALALTIWIGAWAPATGATETGLAFQRSEGRNRTSAPTPPGVSPTQPRPPPPGNPKSVAWPTAAFVAAATVRHLFGDEQLP